MLRPGHAHVVVATTCAVVAVGCDGVLGVHDLPALRDDSAQAETEAGSGDAFDDTATVDATPRCDNPDSFVADPDNCGSCGHSCLGGECVGGVCQSVLLSHEEQYPISMAVDPGPDGFLYVNDYRPPAHTLRIAKDGSKREIVHDETNPNLAPLEIAFDGGQLFWLETTRDTSSGSKLFRAETDGTGLVSRITGGWSFDMSVTPDAIFWIDRWNGGEGAPLLSKIPRDLSTISRVVTRHAGTAYSVWSVGADHDPNGWAYYSADGEIAGFHRVRKDGSADEVISPTVTLSSMRWYDHHIYFVAGAGDSTLAIYEMGEDTKCATTECPFPIVKFPSTANWPTFTLDDQYVYVASFEPHQILRAPRGGGDAVVLGTALTGVTSVAVDEKAVYWATIATADHVTNGRVYRLAK